MAKSAEEHIIALLRDQKHTEACAEILKAYGKAVERYLWGSIRDPAITEELYQDWCTRIWSGLSDFRQESSVRTWIYTIASHLARDWWSRSSRVHTVRLDTDASRLLPAPSVTSPVDRLYRKQVAEYAEDQLSVEERQILILKQRGIPLKEIAEIMQITEEAAKKRYQRAVRRFVEAKKKLEQG